MSDSDKKKNNRRDFILTATTAAGVVGVGAAVWPLIDQMNPDASVKALASTEVDISGVQPGQAITVLWRGKPVFIKRRTQKEIEQAREVDLEDLKHPEKDEDRAKNPEWLVTLGICTHLGCVPLTNKGNFDGHIVLTDLMAPKPKPSRCRRMWMASKYNVDHMPFKTPERVIAIDVKG